MWVCVAREFTWAYTTVGSDGQELVLSVLATRRRRSRGPRGAKAVKCAAAPAVAAAAAATAPKQSVCARVKMSHSNLLCVCVCASWGLFAADAGAAAVTSG